MTAELADRARADARADDFLATLAESRSWRAAVERVRALRAVPGRKPGVCALHETIAAARPAIYAALHRALGGTLLVVVPTPDAAERGFADLLYYLGERGGAVSLLRSRDEAIGAIESPSERSARVTLLAELADGASRLVLAPISAVRQHFMPRPDFERRRFALRAGDEPGWERLLERLFELGYARCDVVSAVGEYAVRGGIVDVFAATAEAPVRIEFFGDRIESMRAFAIESQRSSADVAALAIEPWADAPDERASLFDYLPPDAAIVVDEPATIAAVAGALDEERARERHTLLDGEDAGETLLAGTASAPASLREVGESIARHATLALPGGIETASHAGWIEPALESHVLECVPAEHFNRQIALFSAAMREWMDAGETVFIVSSAVSRTVDLLRAAGIEVGRRARGAIFVDHGSIESGFAIPSLHLRVLGDREIFGAPPKRVKIRAVKEGVPVTLADLRVGDYVVHAVHGIGQYLGLRAETILGATQDYLDLRYAGSDRMLVPVTQMHQIAKYSAAEGATPAALAHGRRRLGAHQNPRLGIAREDRRRARGALRRARDVARLRVRRGHDVADGDGGGVPLRNHPRPAEGDRREQRRHGGRAPDGPPGLRRRRLRKDGGRDACGVQGRRRPQAGRRAGADDAARRPALSHVQRAFRRVPRDRRRALAFHTQGRAEAHPSRSRSKARWTW